MSATLLHPIFLVSLLLLPRLFRLPLLLLTMRMMSISSRRTPRLRLF
jgi:hypothetical protein